MLHFYFYFDGISKIRILEPKKAFCREQQQKRGQISPQIKMTFLKAVRNFTNYVTIFFMKKERKKDFRFRTYLYFYTLTLGPI